MGRMSHWEWTHQNCIDDIKFDLKQMEELSNLIKIGDPTDKGAELLRGSIKELKKHCDKLLKEYEKNYGVKPNMRKLREEVYEEMFER
jgi:hypothetical protein